MQIRRFIILIISTLCLYQCSESGIESSTTGKSDEELKTGQAQSKEKPNPKIYENFEDLEPIFHLQNDTTYLINFWATWCKPCVAELPLFEKLLVDLKGEKYKSVLISLDFPNKIESKLIPFIENNKLKSEVIVLTDSKQQKWIDKVDKEWDGAIPVTLIYKKDKSKFLYGQVHDYEQLKKEVEKILNN